MSVLNFEEAAGSIFMELWVVIEVVITFEPFVGKVALTFTLSVYF